MMIGPIIRSRVFTLRPLGLSRTSMKISSSSSPHRKVILRSFQTNSRFLFQNSLQRLDVNGDKEGRDNSNGKNNGNQNKKDGTPQPPPPPNRQTEIIGAIVTGMVIVALEYALGSAEDATPLSFQDFKVKYLEKGLVKKIYVVNKSYVEAELISKSDLPAQGQSSFFGSGHTVRFTIGSIDFFEEQLDLVQENLGIPLSERIPVSYVEKASWLSYVLPFVPTALLLGGLYWITFKMRSSSSKGTGAGGQGGLGGLFNVGKSKAKLFNQEQDIKVKFKDVAGCDELKEEIMEFVQFLKHPAKYERLGAKIPRGAILSGPPGTGKTLLAKATAGEAGVPFLSVSGSEFVEMFVGVGASRVRDLFQQARKMAPAIIFVDEIDAIGKERSKSGMGSNDEKEATLNQLLVEMDGFDTSDHVVVLAGTNRADILDKALLRPGRFDRHITIDRPDIEGRKEIYKVYLKHIKLKDEITDEFAGKLAALTPGFAGADIANVCNEAALFAARSDAQFVEVEHFEAAIERVIAGLEKKSKVLSPEEKRTVAYHEAGHAICGWYLEFADPLLKVSIIPRGQGALGYAQYLPGDQYLISEEQFMHRMIMALGGRVSEELHFDSVTTGASDDFSKVTRMATAMITKLGMSKKLGTITFDSDKKGQGYQVQKPFSERTAEAIDLEIKRIVNHCHDECTKLLKEKIDDVEKVAQLLLEKEVLNRDDMIRLLGERPFATKNEAFEKYIEK